MPNYTRAKWGRTYFFTVVTYKRRPILCDEKSRETLREVLTLVRISHPFAINAWVLLPDHLHCIWTLPENDVDYSLRWALIKREFTSMAKNWLAAEAISASREKHREGAVWQRRFWEHAIRDEGDYANHCDYIHWNPVKHDLAKNPADWQWSTIHRFIETGLYPNNWGANYDSSQAIERE